MVWLIEISGLMRLMIPSNMGTIGQNYLIACPALWVWSD